MPPRLAEGEAYLTPFPCPVKVATLAEPIRPLHALCPPQPWPAQERIGGRRLAARQCECQQSVSR
jgi:hypothetical protein